MQIKWESHRHHLAERLPGLLARQLLLDITLTAEGRSIRAHRLVLASVSQYFEVRQSDSARVLTT